MSYSKEAVVDGVEGEVPAPENGADQLDVSDPRIRELLDTNPVVRKIVEENGQLFEQFRPQVDPKKLDEAKYQSALHIIETLGLDPLIEGISNKRKFNDQLRAEIERATRSGTPLSLILLDADEFKKINDHHGHLQGDKTIIEMGKRVKGSIRMNDVGAHWGGDEFGIILPDTSGVEAAVVAFRLINTVPSAAPPDYVTLTASVGIAELHQDEDNESLFKRADTALKAAKEFGKDQIVIAETADQELSIESLDAEIQNRVTLIHK